MTESKIFLNTGKKVPKFEFKTKDTVVHRSSTDWNFFHCFYLSLSCKNESSGLLFSEVHTYIQNFTRVNKIEVIFFLRLCAAFHTSPLFIYVRKVYGRILPCPCFPSPYRSIHFGDVSKANASESTTSLGPRDPKRSGRAE